MILRWLRQKAISPQTIAVAVTLVMTVLGSVGIYKAVASVREGIAATRDSHWQRELMNATAQAEARRKDADARAAEAIEKERQTAASLVELRQRAIDLETALSSQQSDPVIYPRTLARELRK